MPRKMDHLFTTLLLLRYLAMNRLFLCSLLIALLGTTACGSNNDNNDNNTSTPDATQDVTQDDSKDKSTDETPVPDTSSDTPADDSTPDGTSDDEGSDSDETSDCGDNCTYPTATEARAATLTAAADMICDGAFTCPYDVSPLTQSFIRGIAKREDCTQEVLRRLQDQGVGLSGRIERAISQGRLNYNPSLAERCVPQQVANYAANACSPNPNFRKGVDADCQGVYTGMVAIGGNCGSAFECAPGSFCGQGQDPNACYGVCADATCGGQACSDRQYCDQDTSTCTDLYTRQAAAACTFDSQCAEGLVCDGNICTDRTDLNSPYFTDPNADCTKGNGKECLPGKFCDITRINPATISGRCADIRERFDTCDNESLCAPGLYCDSQFGGSNECEFVKSEGAMCRRNNECESNQCNGIRCESAPSNVCSVP